MPQLFSYKSKETDPDNIWKIKRRVAKSLRAANDDDRGLAETADMSEETDDVLGQLGKILDNVRELSAEFLNESRKKVNKVVNVPSFNMSVVTTFLNNFKKIDVNKMNASNIEKIESIKDEIQEIVDGIKANLGVTEEGIEASPFVKAQKRKRRTKLQMAAAKAAAEGAQGVEESKGEVEEVQPAMGQDRRIQFKLFTDFFNEVLFKLDDFLKRLELRLLNYRQTSRVLTQEGIKSVEKVGGCMCDVPFQYRPEYQNQMYY